MQKRKNRRKARRRTSRRRKENRKDTLSWNCDSQAFSLALKDLARFQEQLGGSSCYQDSEPLPRNHFVSVVESFWDD